MLFIAIAFLYTCCVGKIDEYTLKTICKAEEMLMTLKILNSSIEFRINLFRKSYTHDKYVHKLKLSCFFDPSEVCPRFVVENLPEVTEEKRVTRLSSPFIYFSWSTFFNPNDIENADESYYCKKIVECIIITVALSLMYILWKTNTFKVCAWESKISRKSRKILQG